ncbi:MAG: hypothetical protein WC365_10105, partial [Candidatus Babeliales bacterium]|jgi:hypothetical protein
VKCTPANQIYSPKPMNLWRINDMALRVRKNGRILCAAKSKPMDGDLYIDDAIHSWLTRCTNISIDVIESLGEDENGEEEWRVKEHD